SDMPLVPDLRVVYDVVDSAGAQRRGHLRQPQGSSARPAGLPHLLDDLPLAIVMPLVNRLGDRRRQCRVVEAVEHSAVAEHLVPKRLRKPRDGWLGPALPTTDENLLPAAVASQVRGGRGHVI